MRLFEDIFIELAALVLTDVGLMKSEGGAIPYSLRWHLTSDKGDLSRTVRQRYWESSTLFPHKRT